LRTKLKQLYQFYIFMELWFLPRQHSCPPGNRLQEPPPAPGTRPEGLGVRPGESHGRY